MEQYSMKEWINKSIFNEESICKDNFIIKELENSALYNNIAWEIITALDADANMIYTKTIHKWIEAMINRLDIFNIDFHNILLPIKSWHDIWTGNGILTNKISDLILQQITYAELFWILNTHLSVNTKQYNKQQLINVYNFLEKRNYWYSDSALTPTIQIQYADLSLISQTVFKSIYTQNPSLIDINTKITNIKNKNTLSSSHNPEIITLFNVFANFSEKEIISASKNIYDTMKKNDIFIPSFFQHTALENDRKLYDNKETEFWIKTAIKEKYKKWHKELRFSVEFWNDWRNYIDVWVYEDKTKIYHHGFRSYRDTKEYLTKIFEDIWLNIYMRLESPDKRQIAPILRKE